MFHEDRGERHSGELPYQRLVTHATTSSRSKELDAVMGAAGTSVQEHMQYSASHPILETLLDMNAAETVPEGMVVYGRLLHLGEPGDRARADLTAESYRRNLRVFSNVTRLVDSPNDRVRVVFGSGRLGWLPGFPRSADFTLRMLLNHTSGLGEYTERPFEDLVRDAGRNYTNEELVAYMARINPLFVHEPGTGWSYSNTGYVLLGVIAERATGAALPTLIDQQLAAPAGLRETAWDTDPERAPRRAKGYGFNGGSTLTRHGSGYGLGVWTGTTDGRRVLWHAGSTAGFAADARHYPDDRISIVMLANADSRRMGSEPRRIREAVLNVVVAQS